MALKKNQYLYTIVFILLIGCNHKQDDNYQVFIKKQSLTCKEYMVAINGKRIDLSFSSSQRGLNKNDIYLKIRLNHGLSDIRSQNFIATSYENLMLSLDLVLKTMTKDYDISNLHSIEFEIIELGRECLIITRDYKKVYGDGNNIKGEDLIHILKHSDFISNIKEKIAVYGLTVKDISVENPFFTTWDDFCSYNINRDIEYGLISNKILRAIVYVSLQKG